MYSLCSSPTLIIFKKNKNLKHPIFFSGFQSIERMIFGVHVVHKHKVITITSILFVWTIAALSMGFIYGSNNLHAHP